jgi:hypothetical protein
MSHHEERPTEPTEPIEPRPEEDDVEGHGGMASRVEGGPDDFMHSKFNHAKIDDADDDVEGHFGSLKSPSSRGE